MDDLRSAYFGLTGKYPTDVQENAAEDYSARLAASPWQRLAALASWISGAQIAGGVPGPRFGSLKLSPLAPEWFKRAWQSGVREVPRGAEQAAQRLGGPVTEIPEELMKEIGGGFGKLRRGSLSRKTAQALEGRNPVGSPDIPSWEAVASTESPGGR